MQMKKRLSQIPFQESVDSWESLMFLYNSAIREVRTKLDILNDEFQHIHRYNPIEYIESRLKSPESIMKKLTRHGYETTMQNMVDHVSDIAGVRLVCSFTSDIYRIAEMICNLRQFEVVKIKDYIKQPKQSGYRSYHIIVNVPIYTTTDIVYTKAEIQIRTIAMDFWASLDHQLKYKKDIGTVADEISEDLRQCAEVIAATDQHMLQIRKRIEDKNGKHAPQ